jgi:cytochrome-b5 reductase
LAAEDKGFRVHYVLNNPPENWEGGVGFVTPEMMTVNLLSLLHTFHIRANRVLQKWLPKPAEDVKILLCGPPPMISAMKKGSESLGFKKAKPVSKLEDQVFAF